MRVRLPWAGQCRCNAPTLAGRAGLWNGRPPVAKRLRKRTAESRAIGATGTRKNADENGENGERSTERRGAAVRKRPKRPRRLSGRPKTGHSSAGAVQCLPRCQVRHSKPLRALLRSADDSILAYPLLSQLPFDKHNRRVLSASLFGGGRCVFLGHRSRQQHNKAKKAPDTRIPSRIRSAGAVVVAAFPSWQPPCSRVGEPAPADDGPGDVSCQHLRTQKLSKQKTKVERWPSAVQCCRTRCRPRSSPNDGSQSQVRKRDRSRISVTQTLRVRELRRAARRRTPVGRLRPPPVQSEVNTVESRSCVVFGFSPGTS